MDGQNYWVHTPGDEDRTPITNPNLKRRMQEAGLTEIPKFLVTQSSRCFCEEHDIPGILDGWIEEIESLGGYLIDEPTTEREPRGPNWGCSGNKRRLTGEKTAAAMGRWVLFDDDTSPGCSQTPRIRYTLNYIIPRYVWRYFRDTPAEFKNQYRVLLRLFSEPFMTDVGS